MKLYVRQSKPLRGGMWIGAFGKVREIRDYIREEKKTARGERTA